MPGESSGNIVKKKVFYWNCDVISDTHKISQYIGKFKPGPIKQPWERLKFARFDPTQSQKVFILTQLMTHNGFQELIPFNSWLKQLSRELTQNQLTAQADLQVLIQIDSIQAAFQGIDSESTHDSKGSLDIGSNRLKTQAKKNLILSRLMI